MEVVATAGISKKTFSLTTLIRSFSAKQDQHTGIGIFFK